MASSSNETSMASSSNENSTSSPREKYPYPMEYFNVLDFVPKLLSEGNYENWKLLMQDFIRMRGLIGFIEGAAVEKSNRDEAWNRSNNLVRGWILATLSEDTRLRVLRCKTAVKMWTRLEIIFDATRARWQIDEKTEYRHGHYLPLQKAIRNGEWDKAMGIIEEEPDAVRTPIALYSATALSFAICSKRKGRDRFVRQLLERMTPQEVVDLVDDGHMTALHYAAQSDHTEVAKMLVNKNSNLPNVVDKSGRTPLHHAAYFGSSETVRYLKEVTREDILLADDMGAATLLSCLTRAELYDIALTWLRRKPEMACVQVTEIGTPFDILAEKQSSFPSANCFNFWQSLIYSGVPVKSKGIANHRSKGGGREDIENSVAANCCVSVRQILHFMIWEVAEKLVPCVKCIREIKERQHHALELVKLLCMEVAKLKLSEVERIFKPALRIAARVGIPEIIEEIAVSYPLAMSFVILDNLNIFIYAIMYRRERVFNLVYDSGRDLSYIYGADNSLNNCLHVVARLRHEQQINLKASVAGAVLQMQREVQWFKEVEKFARPGDKERRNRDGMTPAEVFSDTHQGLVKEAEQWMKDTATSCTIVAPLLPLWFLLLPLQYQVETTMRTAIPYFQNKRPS